MVEIRVRFPPDRTGHPTSKKSALKINSWRNREIKKQPNIGRRACYKKGEMEIRAVNILTKRPNLIKSSPER